MNESPRQLPAQTRREDELTVGEPRELGAIVADVWENAEKLVRQELELGLAELDRRVDKLKTGLLTATVGGAVLYAGLLVLLAALVLGLSKVMEPWIAALVVGVIVTGAGTILSIRGEHEAVSATRPDERGERTIRAMKEAIK